MEQKDLFDKKSLDTEFTIVRWIILAFLMMVVLREVCERLPALAHAAPSLGLAIAWLSKATLAGILIYETYVWVRGMRTKRGQWRTLPSIRYAIVLVGLAVMTAATYLL